VALSDCRGHAHGPNRSCTPGEMRWPSGGVRLPSYPHHFISLFGVRPCCCSWLDHAVRDRISRPHVDSWAVKFTGRQIHGPSNSRAVKFTGRQIHGPSNSWAGKIHVVNGSTQGGSLCVPHLSLQSPRSAPVIVMRHRAEQDGAWVGGLTDPMLAKGGGARRQADPRTTHAPPLRSWHGGRRQMSRRP
jgi:hypothetical protein